MLMERTEFPASYGTLVLEEDHGVWSLVAMRSGGSAAAASVVWSEGSRVGLDDLVNAIAEAERTEKRQAVRTRRGTIGLYPPGSTPSFVPAGGLRVIFANASGARARWDGTLGHIGVTDLQRSLRFAQRALRTTS